VQWSRRAEERGFSSLATGDRIAYPSHDLMLSLAAAAAVTDRIGLLTNILLLPTRNPVLLAKEAATLQSVSGGRLTLGVGVGGREDDFTAVGVPFAARGRRADEMIETLVGAWRGETVAGSPKPVTAQVPAGGVPLLVGGQGEAGVRRAAAVGIGWTAGGMPPDQVAPMVQRVREAWRERGRAGEPRIVALTYYSLGPDVEAASRTYLLDYYAFLGDLAAAIANGALRSAEQLRNALSAYDEAGVDELVLGPTVASLEQVDRLADVVFETSHSI
jgi:alkanesulfonate monooxygenase SsuD/methylene tetrahydromethanopterin reductase-like flavin-dependent oxidoreductase (luciferase family)